MIMSTVGDGYGSQYHLRQWVNGNQTALNAHIEDAYRTLNLPLIDSISWVSPLESDGFRELAGMEYFSETGRFDVVDAWTGFWPQSGRPQMWDGWAVVRFKDGTEEILVVEAKANSSEFETPGTGSKGRSRVNILRSLDEAKAFLDVPIDAVWYETYYQFCNRLTALYFLNEQVEVPSRLLMIYFIGDQFPDGRDCPQSQDAWGSLISKMDRAIKLPRDHRYSARVLDVFPNVTLDR